MSKNRKSQSKDEIEDMLPHYDFSKGKHMGYHKKFSKGIAITILSEDDKPIRSKFMYPKGIIVLDEDVKNIFPDSKSVNDALRHIIAAIPKRTKKKAA